MKSACGNAEVPAAGRLLLNALCAPQAGNRAGIVGVSQAEEVRQMLEALQPGGSGGGGLSALLPAEASGARRCRIARRRCVLVGSTDAVIWQPRLLASQLTGSPACGWLAPAAGEGEGDACHPPVATCCSALGPRPRRCPIFQTSWRVRAPGFDQTQLPSPPFSFYTFPSLAAEDVRCAHRWGAPLQGIHGQPGGSGEQQEGSRRTRQPRCGSGSLLRSRRRRVPRRRRLGSRRVHGSPSQAAVGGSRL